MPPQLLWERDRQLHSVDELLAGARGGRGGTCFLLGEGGIGKTALLDEVSRRAGSDVLVARARCDPMEATLPFGLLSQVAHALGGTDDGVWLSTDAHGGADARSATFYRSLRWLQQAARG